MQLSELKSWLQHPEDQAAEVVVLEVDGTVTPLAEVICHAVIDGVPSVILRREGVKPLEG